MEKIIQNEFVKLLKTDIKNDIVSELMEKFEDEIVIYEDQNDPMRPSICREEFKSFLEETIENSIEVKGNSIGFNICDEKKLGIGEKLDDQTTDCLRIIATILGGISGRYVLLFADEVGQPIGRTGKAFLLVRSDFDERSKMFGWEQRPDWKFSNFRGIPDFFDVDMDKHIDKSINKIIKGLK